MLQLGDRILTLISQSDSNVPSFFFLQLIHAGKGEAIRIRSILRSLIPLGDLVGVISIAFPMPTIAKGEARSP